MSPYDLLGVARDASPDSIKAAFRAKAKRLHPDVGGDPQAFDKVSRAFDVLSDPDRRARYDETGETGEAPSVDPVRVGALELVAALVDQATADLNDDAHIDLKAQMRTVLSQGAARMKQEQANLAKRRAKLEKTAARWTFKGEGDDIIAAMFVNKRRGVEQDEKTCAHALAVNAEALRILDGYECAVTPARPAVNALQMAASNATMATSAASIGLGFGQRARRGPF